MALLSSWARGTLMPKYHLTAPKRAADSELVTLFKHSLLACNLQEGVANKCKAVYTCKQLLMSIVRGERFSLSGCRNQSATIPFKLSE